jgi:amino acid adenylation domain-containing protein
VTVVGLLEKLRALDVRLWAENGQLKISAPRGVLTPELTEELRRLKPELLQHLVDGGASEPDEPLTASAAAGNEAPFSLAQRRFWFFEQMQPGSSVLHIPATFRIGGGLDVAALERTLTAMVARHETLRTRIAETDEGAEQYIEPPFAVSLDHVDLRTQDDLLAEVHRHQAEIFNAPFHFLVGPLWRARLLRTRDDEWLLLLVIHHLVADGWSLGVLLHEIGRTYSSITAGQESQAPLPVQYRDFAAWQARRLDQPAMARQLEWWTGRLAQPLPVLDLPLDGMRPPIQTYNGRAFRGTIPAELTERIAAAARKEGATLFMALLTVFNVLLSRWSGQRDVIVGVPVAGRVRAELEPLIGVFINTLPIRIDVDRDLTFVDLLRHVRDTTIDALANQEIPFERIVQELNLPRDLSRSPVFQVLFNMFDRSGPAKVPFADGSIEIVADDAHADAKFDLTFYAYAGETGVDCMLVYNADLFSSERIEALFHQYIALVDRLATRPGASINDVSLIPASAAAGLPAATAPLARTWAGSVLERLTAHAESAADRIALVDASSRWSYAEVERRTNQLGRRLIELGAGPGAVVAIYGSRTNWLPAAIISIWKAGSAFVVLDPAHPRQRLQRCVDAASPVGTLVLDAAAWTREPLAAADGRWALMLSEEAWAADIAHLASEPTPSALDPDGLAYVAFTSGSTGVPKGIRGTHRPIAHFLDWYSGRFGISSADTVSALSGLSHDPLLRDILTPLWVGGQLAMPPAALIREPRLLHHWLREQHVTVSHLTPSLAEMLVDAATPESAPTVPLRLVCLGGEPLRSELAKRIGTWAPAATVVNAYGATETPQIAAYHVVEPASSALSPRYEPIGRGIDDVQLLLLTGAGRQAAVGELGEITVRTAYLADGYLDDPVSTTERFAANPLAAPGASDTIYKTGDLGRYLPDGRVEYAGRRDTQIKIRGYRVESGEVEAALLEVPGITGAAVVVRRDESGNASLAAFWTGATSSAADVASFVRSRLSDYMMPSAWQHLAALPLTPNGKIDRAALERLKVATDAPEVAPREPETATEKAVAELWQSLLSRSIVGRDDSFFALGGHSLVAARLSLRLHQQLGVDVPVRTIFERPVLRDFAATIDQLAPGSQQTAGRIGTIERTDALPLSFTQERIWFHHQLEPESKVYHIVNAVRLRGPLDGAAFARAWETVVERHEMLRARVVSVEGVPHVKIGDGSAAPLRREDWSQDPSELRGRQLERLLEEQSTSPFDLESGPLALLTIVRESADEHVIVLRLHHIISDQWSMQVLGRDLADCYNHFAHGAALELTPLPIGYVDYADWQKKWLQGEVWEQQLAYWTEKLKALPTLTLPSDRQRKPGRAEGRRESLLLPPTLVASVLELSAQLAVTPFMVLLGAYAVLLRRYTRSADLPIGVPVANRRRPEIESVVGAFINTVVMRVDTAGDPTFAELLKRVRDIALEADAHQDTPFERLVAALQPSRDATQAPLVQVMFNLLTAAPSPPRLQGIEAALVPLERHGGAADLMLVANLDAGVLSADYRADLFDSASMRALLEHYVTVLTAAVAAPTQAIGTLPMLSAGELAQLSQWNDTRRTWPLGPSAAGLFEAQAKATPDRIAIEDGRQGLTYADLDRRANQLAHVLQSFGVGPDVLVGIGLERSVMLPVAMLAVWKAGGAYVPLDPAYPAARLHDMIADSELRVLLTEDHLQEVWPSSEGMLLTLDGVASRVAASPATPPVRQDSPHQLAYVIYTSGSTGKPKGVQIPQGALVNFLRSMAESPGCTPDDVMLAVTTLSFDIAGLELHLPLTVGARIALASREETTDGQLLLDRLAASHATILQATPATWRLLLEAGWSGTPGLKVLCGGEPMTRDLADALLPRADSVWNMYGPTETTVWSTIERVEPGDGTILVGRPIANTECWVLDQNRQPLPVGVPGELYLGGDGVARGYHRRPELTAERFVPNPFGAGRLYRTGDLARYRPDGRLECLGRLDNQVKVRGHRIELGEIEAVLEQHPSVAQGVVVVHGSVSDARLVAYVVVKAGMQASHSEWRQFLRQHLPPYMLPTLYVEVGALPLTPAGKIDRKALPDPLRTAAQRPAGEPPRTPAEIAVAAIWSEVLKGGTVHRDDNFFDIGGHSLASMQVIARIEKNLGVKIPPAALMMETLEQVAARCNGPIALTAMPTASTPEPLASELEPATSPAKSGFTSRLVKAFKNAVTRD